MFESVRHRENGGGSAIEVDIAPLIDVVFILLIFFLVTTTFVRDTGITVERPEAYTAGPIRSENMRVSIAPSGAVYTEGRQVSLAECSDLVRQFLKKRPDGSVVIIPDGEVTAKRLVAVMDAAKRAGAQHVAVATRQKKVFSSQ